MIKIYVKCHFDLYFIYCCEFVKTEFKIERYTMQNYELEHVITGGLFAHTSNIIPNLFLTLIPCGLLISL